MAGAAAATARANRAFTLPGKRAARLEPALLKGALETVEALSGDAHKLLKPPDPDAPFRRPPVRQPGAGAAPASARSIISSPPASSGPSRRSCIRRRSFSTCRARRSAAACSSPPTPPARSFACRPEYTIPVCRAYLAFGQGRRRRRIFLSRPGVPGARGAGRRADADRARKLRPHGRRGGRRGSVRAEPSRRRRRRGAARSPRGSATPACSTACWLRWKFRKPGAGACAAASPAGAASTPFSAARARARSRSRACWRRWKAPITPAPRRWSRTCSRSPASRRSAGAAPARSPIGFSNRRRSGRGRRSKPEKRAVLDAFLAISGDPDDAAVELRRLAHSAGLDLERRARRVRAAQRLHRRPRRRDRGDPLQRRLRARFRLLHRLRVRGPRSRRLRREDRACRWTLRRARAAARRE